MEAITPDASVRAVGVSKLLAELGLKPLDACILPVAVPWGPLAIDTPLGRERMLDAFAPTATDRPSADEVTDIDRVRLAACLRGGIFPNGALAHMSNIPLVEKIIDKLREP